MLEPAVHGHVDPQFERVKRAFASCFEDQLEQGGAVAIVLDGKPVADLWGGFADATATRPWRRDTLVNVWSVTKGVMAIALARLVEQGKIHYDRPVAEVWPEFAANGKGSITLDHVLSHRAGLSGLSVPMDLPGLYAWHPYVSALAAMAPLWTPGTNCAYHALTFGHLVGEPLRRASGLSVGAFVSAQIAEPLDVPFYIGLPGAEDHRVAELIEGPKASDWVDAVLKSPFPYSCRNPELSATEPNNRAWRAAEIPGGNGHSDARALATIYGSLVRSKSPLIARDTLAEASRIRFQGMDDSFAMPAAYAAGFSVLDPIYGRRASPAAIGHSGWGGAIAFADPSARLGFAYVTCRMLGFDDGIDPRRQRLIEAVYDCL